MHFTIFTLFPEWFNGPLGDSILQRARDAGRVKLDLVNIREHATDKHRSVDDTPYGGGGGMVLRADVLARAMDNTIGTPGKAERPHTILLSPRGKTFDQQTALRLARLPALALVCGHYEAVDQRLIDTRIDEEISLGDFVLTGGEIPAMAMVDAIARLLPGVLGNESSAWEDSFMNGLLEGPHYTRPDEFEGHKVPPVLLSGDHGAIAEWREEQALEETHRRRPELFARQILWPAQVRRIARRAQPFVVWKSLDGSPPEPLFTCHSVRNNPFWPEILGRVRWEPGILPVYRLSEIRAARSVSPDKDRKHLLADIDAYLRALEAKQTLPDASSPEAETLVRNLHRIITAPQTPTP